VSTERERDTREIDTNDTNTKKALLTLSLTRTPTNECRCGRRCEERGSASPTSSSSTSSSERGASNTQRQRPERSRPRVCSSSSSSLPMSPRSCSEPARRESLFISRDSDVKVSESLLLIDWLVGWLIGSGWTSATARGLVGCSIPLARASASSFYRLVGPRSHRRSKRLVFKLSERRR